MATGPTKKKRGRKPKNAGDDASLVGGRASTAVSAVSGKNRRTSISRGQSPDEEDDEQAENMGVALVARTNEEKEKEKYYRSMLVNALDPDQYLRYERWRSSKLSDNIVRRVSHVFSPDNEDVREAVLILM
jgi:transcription initiation factor TFIID subunit 11